MQRPAGHGGRPALLGSLQRHPHKVPASGQGAASEGAGPHLALLTPPLRLLLLLRHHAWRALAPSGLASARALWPHCVHSLAASPALTARARLCDTKVRLAAVRAAARGCVAGGQEAPRGRGPDKASPRPGPHHPPMHMPRHARAARRKPTWQCAPPASAPPACADPPAGSAACARGPRQGRACSELLHWQAGSAPCTGPPAMVGHAQRGSPCLYLVALDAARVAMVVQVGDDEATPELPANALMYGIQYLRPRMQSVAMQCVLPGRGGQVRSIT